MHITVNIELQIYVVEILQYMICPWSSCVNNRNIRGTVAILSGYYHVTTFHLLFKYKIKINITYGNITVP